MGAGGGALRVNREARGGADYSGACELTWAYAGAESGG